MAKVELVRGASGSREIGARCEARSVEGVRRAAALTDTVL